MGAGAHISANDKFVFDAQVGMIAIQGTESLDMQMPGNFEADFCVRIDFPTQLIPPTRQYVEHGEQMYHRMVEQLKQDGKESDVTINGQSVQIFTGGTSPPITVGLLAEGTPVGVGCVPPSDGTWKEAMVEFSNWERGAGPMDTDMCKNHISVTEYLSRPQSNATLKVLDALMDSLTKSDVMSEALFPFKGLTKTSEIFQSAAALEEKTQPKCEERQHQLGEKQQLQPLVEVAAIAAVAGVMGAALALSVLRPKREVRLWDSVI